MKLYKSFMEGIRMFKKLMIAATFIAPIYASEEAAQPTQDATIEENQQTLSESIALMIKDLEKMINYMHIVKQSSYNIDRIASAQRTTLVVLTKMQKITDAGVSIEEVARFNEVYKTFKQVLRETYEGHTAEADMHEDAIEATAEETEVDVETVIA